jgi:hypothetical protein
MIGGLISAGGGAGLMGAVVPSYNGFRFPVEIISHCVWLYYRFPLSFRDVEEMMLQLGIVVSHETIRQWSRKGIVNLLKLSGGTGMAGSGGSVCGACVRPLWLCRWPRSRWETGKDRGRQRSPGERVRCGV